MARPAPTPLDSGLLVSKGNGPTLAPAPEPTPEVHEDETVPSAPKRVGPVSGFGRPVPPPRKSSLAPKAKVERVALTVKIKPTTLKRLRVAAVNADLEQQDIVEEAISNWLDVNA
jgi:hypothetical protein